jgi:hypothetical protein
MESWGYVILAGAALVVGLLAQALVLGRRVAVDAALAMLGAAVGGYVASERLGSWSAWGPAWYGLRLGPAVVGSLIVGVVVATIVAVVWRSPSPPADSAPAPAVTSTATVSDSPGLRPEPDQRAGSMGESQGTA